MGKQPRHRSGPSQDAGAPSRSDAPGKRPRTGALGATVQRSPARGAGARPGPGAGGRVGPATSPPDESSFLSALGFVPDEPAPPAAAPVQRKTPDADAASGRKETTDYGTYWVVPDSVTTPQADADGEQITATAFAALTAAWTRLRDGSGSIRITETGSDGTVYAGFKAKMLAQFGKLLSQPVGRGVVLDLVSGAKTVTIMPSGAGTIGGARRGAGSLQQADGTAGAGGDTTILIEAGLTDTDIVCFDAAGNEISAPVFLILGHELIHAQHNAAGRNVRGVASTDSAYPNLEEERTIATDGGPTENKLRAEHGLGVRHGHHLRDTR